MAVVCALLVGPVSPLHAQDKPGASTKPAPSTKPAASTKPDKPRFVNRGHYVEDTKTGLLWQKDGNASGKLNFQQAEEYAKKQKFGGLTGWRVPTRAELEAIFPAIEKPFVDTMYTKQECCGGPHKTDNYSYWMSELDGPPEEDYAYVYQW